MEGALIHEVEAGFVAVDEGQGGAIGETREGVGHAVEVASRGLSGGLFVDEAGFDGPGAAQTPMGCDHLLDHGEFQAGGRPQVVDVVGKRGSEGFRTFVFQDHTLSQQAVAASVLSGALFPLRGERAVGESSVGAISEHAAK